MNAYIQSLFLADRVYRLFLDGLKHDLHVLNIKDITTAQAIILYNIGNEHLSVSELSSRKYYLGTNISYNLRKMAETGYVSQTASERDQRVQYIALTDKGLGLYDTLEKTFQSYLQRVEQQDLNDLKKSLKTLENDLILHDRN